jgi:hypothetical protein
MRTLTIQKVVDDGGFLISDSEKYYGETKIEAPKSDAELRTLLIAKYRLTHKVIDKAIDDLNRNGTAVIP